MKFSFQYFPDFPFFSSSIICSLYLSHPLIVPRQIIWSFATIAFEKEDYHANNRCRPASANEQNHCAAKFRFHFSPVFARNPSVPVLFQWNEEMWKVEMNAERTEMNKSSGTAKENQKASKNGKMRKVIRMIERYESDGGEETQRYIIISTYLTKSGL